MKTKQNKKTWLPLLLTGRNKMSVLLIYDLLKKDKIVILMLKDRALSHLFDYHFENWSFISSVKLGAK